VGTVKILKGNGYKLEIITIYWQVFYIGRGQNLKGWTLIVAHSGSACVMCNLFIIYN
jgi:hypothetical protein